MEINEPSRIECENDILELHKQSVVTEGELLNILNRYNLRDALILCSRLSKGIREYHGKNKIGHTAIRDPQTGIIISQHFLAYLSNLIIICGTNDYKKKKLSEKEHNVIALTSLYTGKLETPESRSPLDEDSFKSFWIRSFFEQIDGHQFDAATILSRNLFFYLDILPTLEKKEELGNLQDIFFKENGLTLEDYFKIGFCFFAIADRDLTFDKKPLFTTTIEELKAPFLKVDNFLDMCCINYEKFRFKDEEMNKNIPKNFTKNRFNNLFTHPIIQTQYSENNRDLIIPSFTAYIHKVFLGVFWWFNNYYEKKGLALSFRDYFGKEIFENYVKIILESIYGMGEVKKYILSNGEEFFDWYVEQSDKVYFFEAKAYQFNLLNKTTAEKDKIIKEELGKISYAYKQVNNNLKRINEEKELEKFKSKKIIAIVIFLKIPMVETTFWNSWLLATGIKEEIIPLSMNIEDLELYENCKNDIELEKIINQVRAESKKSFHSIFREYKKDKLRNSLLDDRYIEFAKSMAGSQYKELK